MEQRHIRKEADRSWCGQVIPEGEWAWIDPYHAKMPYMDFRPCQKCLQEIESSSSSAVGYPKQ